MEFEARCINCRKKCDPNKLYCKDCELTLEGSRQLEIALQKVEKIFLALYEKTGVSVGGEFTVYNGYEKYTYEFRGENIVLIRTENMQRREKNA